MATSAERQRKFREKIKGKFKKLEVLLPVEEFALLSGNAKEQGFTQSKYILSLLYGNKASQPQHNAIDLIEENKKLVKKNNLLTIKANKEHLQFKELESKQTKHNKQLEGLNQTIYELNDKPLKEELDQYKDTNFKLALERDTEHDKVIKLESIVNSLSGDKVAMRATIVAMENAEHNCQALTKKGVRCSNPAKEKKEWHGVEINVCLQHSKGM